MSQGSEEVGVGTISSLEDMVERARERTGIREWIGGDSVKNYLLENSEKIQKSFPRDWPISPVVPEGAVLKEAFEIAGILGAERITKTYKVPEFPEYNALCVYIGSYDKVVNVRELVLGSGGPFLSVVLAIVTASSFPLLLQVWIGVSIGGLIYSIYKSYEKLTDPHEILVYGTIIYSQSKSCAENHKNSWGKRVYDKIFGINNPDIGTITTNLRDVFKNREMMKAMGLQDKIRLMPKTAEITTALKWLQQKKIVYERNGRYGITI